jgi:hypothetical protein
MITEIARPVGPRRCSLPSSVNTSLVSMSLANLSWGQAEQEPTMEYGPDWNWIGYLKSFDDESGNGGGGGKWLWLLVGP